MRASWKKCGWKLYWASWLAFGGLTVFLSDRATAQIAPDATLGTESSVVSPNVDINGISSDRVDGGAIRGTNLFHSFQEFNVGEGKGAYFSNPSGIQNILSRVTGGNPSEILGKLGVLGNANLFLINPNGIIFGSNATLDVRGSFLASTAKSLKLADGNEFSATPAQTTPLLTVSVPIGLQFGTNSGSIRVQGNGQGLRGTNPALIDTPFGLRVPSNQTLALVGGNLALEGGTLKTAGGRIELGSVAGTGLVNLIPTAKGWALGYTGVSDFGDIQLSAQASVDASGEGGGDIQVQGKRLTIQDSSVVEANTLRSEPGGILVVKASELIELSSDSTNVRPLSAIASQVYRGATGAGGDVLIETRRLVIRDGTQISASTFGQGKGGNLTVNANDFVQLIGSSADGQVNSSLLAEVSREATGSAGELRINTGKFIARDGGQVRANTFGQGKGGNLTVNANDSVELIGMPTDNRLPSGIYTQAARGSTGAAGELRIDTGKLTVRSGGQVSASTSGAGQGGNLFVNANDFVELIGRSPDSRLPSTMSAQANRGSTGASGELRIDTGKLIARDGGQVSAGTFGQGKGGNLTVNANDSVKLIGRSADGRVSGGLFTSTQGAGAAGDLRINTGKLIVRDGATISLSSEGTSNASNLQVKAGSIQLDNQGGILATSELGNGGNLTLQAQNLLQLRGNSKINTTAGRVASGGDGGNINIDAALLVAAPSENNDITANAFSGRGGRVEISASGIFGLAPRRLDELKTLLGTNDPNQVNPARLLSSDITAISQTNPALSGQVDINASEVDLSRDLVELPTVPVEAEVKQVCQPRGGKQQNEFVVTGRGGLPPSPTQALNNDAIQIDWVTLSSRDENRLSQAETTSPTNSTPAPIVEATGWEIGDNGEIVLTASKVPLQPHSSWQAPNECRATRSNSIY